MLRMKSRIGIIRYRDNLEHMMFIHTQNPIYDLHDRKICVREIFPFTNLLGIRVDNGVRLRHKHKQDIKFDIHFLRPFGRTHSYGWPSEIRCLAWDYAHIWASEFIEYIRLVKPKMRDEEQMDKHSKVRYKRAQVRS